MIKRLVVKNLNNKGEKGNFDLEFHDDLNVFTGRNGSGKTTLLKLIWYATMGELGRIVEEIPFDELYFKTKWEEVILELELSREPGLYQPFFFFLASNNEEIYLKEEFSQESMVRKFRRRANYPSLLHLSEHTIFFPTFRRIEGGFGIDNQEGQELKKALERWNNQLINSKAHQLITAISLNDVHALLIQNYAILSEKVIEMQAAQSEAILEKIQQNKQQEKATLAAIKEQVLKSEDLKKQLLVPLRHLSSLVTQLFEDKGIKVAEGIFLGNPEKALHPDQLSFGEKQMLSFLAYNMFHQNTAIFIDEPEISLHTDWQQMLFPLLLEMGNNNQIFIATHSPYIYAKYPDKEFFLDQLQLATV